MMRIACGAMFIIACGLSAPARSQETASAARITIPYSDVRPILQSLRNDLFPAELRAKTSSDVEALWPDWASRQDALIRARVKSGDEDSIIHFLLFGTTFTKRPRTSERDLAALVLRPAEATTSLQGRISDLVAAVASPGANERLQFTRQVLMRSGIDPATDLGRRTARDFLEDRTRRAMSSGAIRSSTLLDASAELSDKLTLFRERGLSSDTSIFIDYGVEETLERIKTSAAIPPTSIRRVAIVGPGLDFTDKLEGYDFYPQQTIQPFAVIDSLIRTDLADRRDLRVDAFDLSSRVIQHLEAARDRARAGTPYALNLPRNVDRPWTENLVKYWNRLGDRIGEGAKSSAAPPGAGRVDVHSILVRPSVVLATTTRDLNIVVQRLEPSAQEKYDLILATNILLYYDVFEQSLAVANIAAMLRPGGFLLTNNRVFELPASPMAEVGHTDVVYMELPGIGPTGDQIVWYQKQ
jgi:hypothetical protein